jgi:hypothetical protein
MLVEKCLFSLQVWIVLKGGGRSDAQTIFGRSITAEMCRYHTEIPAAASTGVYITGNWIMSVV